MLSTICVSIIVVAMSCDICSFVLGLRRLRQNGPSGVPFLGTAFFGSSALIASLCGVVDWRVARNAILIHTVLQVTVQIGVVYCVYLALIIPLPHRDEKGKSRYRNREWATLTLGTLTLPKGSGTLTLQPVHMPGSQVMDLKHVELRLLKSGLTESTAN